jgi:hypothetical protein
VAHRGVETNYRVTQPVFVPNFGSGLRLAIAKIDR